MDAFGSFHPCDFTRRIILIGGTKYARGDEEVDIRVMNFSDSAARRAAHGTARPNVGADGVTALFFGLSGTGKTTLSADPARRPDRRRTNTAGARPASLILKVGAMQSAST